MTEHEARQEQKSWLGRCLDRTFEWLGRRSFGIPHSLALIPLSVALFRLWDPKILPFFVGGAAAALVFYPIARGYSSWADQHPTTTENRLTWKGHQGLVLQKTRVHYEFPQIDAIFWFPIIVGVALVVGSAFYGFYRNVRDVLEWSGIDHQLGITEHGIHWRNATTIPDYESFLREYSDCSLAGRAQSRIDSLLDQIHQRSLPQRHLSFRDVHQIQLIVEGTTPQGFSQNNFASSEESVGELRLGKSS